MSSVPPVPPTPPTEPKQPFPAHWPEPGKMQAPPDFTDILPYLNPPQWEGNSSCLCRPLMDTERMPSVSFGRGLMNGIGMILTRTACEEGFTISKVEPIAIKNLAARKDRPAWQTDDVEWQGESRTIYYRTGDELTASDLLDEEFLAAMHASMDCDDVVIAIPTANMMIACPRDMARGLSPMAEQQYADVQSQGQEVLTPLIIAVTAGKLQGFLDLGEPTEDFPGPDTDET